MLLPAAVPASNHSRSALGSAPQEMSLAMSVVFEHEQAPVPTQMDSSGDVEDATDAPGLRLRLFASAPSSSNLAVEKPE